MANIEDIEKVQAALDNPDPDAIGDERQAFENRLQEMKNAGVPPPPNAVVLQGMNPDVVAPLLPKEVVPKKSAGLPPPVFKPQANAGQTVGAHLQQLGNKQGAQKNDLAAAPKNVPLTNNNLINPAMNAMAKQEVPKDPDQKDAPSNLKTGVKEIRRTEDGRERGVQSIGLANVGRVSSVSEYKMVDLKEKDQLQRHVAEAVARCKQSIQAYGNRSAKQLTITARVTPDIFDNEVFPILVEIDGIDYDTDTEMFSKVPSKVKAKDDDKLGEQGEKSQKSEKKEESEINHPPIDLKRRNAGNKRSADEALGENAPLGKGKHSKRDEQVVEKTVVILGAERKSILDTCEKACSSLSKDAKEMGERIRNLVYEPQLSQSAYDKMMAEISELDDALKAQETKNPKNTRQNKKEKP